MSVTFRAWDPNLDHFVDAGDFAGLRSARPETMGAVDCNFHNQGAADLCRLLGLSDDCWGRVSAVELPSVRRAIIRVRNVSGRRAPFTVEPVSEGRFHSGGQTDEQILRRLNELDAVVTHCLDNGWDLQWG